MSGEPEGRRERRWREVHDRVYDAALELFLVQGFVATSYDEIAERADVARKTAFNHFPHKTDFIGEWGQRRRSQVESELRPDLAEGADISALLRHYFEQLTKINMAERPLTRRMFGAWRESGGPFAIDVGELAWVVTGMITEGQRLGQIRRDVDPRRVSVLLYSGYFGTMFDWIAGTDEEPPFDLQDALTFLLDTVLPGLRESR
jgi:AcrR family transcriptional regulator